MVLHIYNPSIQEVETGGFQSQPRLHRESQSQKKMKKKNA
jgi:hypothetical protein